VATCSHRSVSTLAGTWSSRSLNQEFDRANKIDPDTQIDDTARPDSTTRETAREAFTGKQGPPAMPRAR